jgi:hypothetical protein
MGRKRKVGFNRPVTCRSEQIVNKVYIIEGISNVDTIEASNQTWYLSNLKESEGSA